MELHEFATHNLIPTALANQLGYGRPELRRACATGQIKRVIRGWYAVRSPTAERAPWEGDTPWEAATNRHLLLASALVLSFEGRVAASHQSALVLTNAPTFGTDLTRAHVCRVANSNTRHRPLATIHPPVEMPTRTSPGGLLVVHQAAAAVQVGLIDQGAGKPNPMASLVAADWLLHNEVITPHDLQEALDFFTRHPGIAAVRTWLVHVDGRHESPGETRLAAVLRILGYSFTPQVWIEVDGQMRRVDFLLDGERVCIEFDGMAKYAVDGLSPQALRLALTNEKEREDAIRGDDYAFARIYWADLDQPWIVKAKVEKARALARRFRSAG